MNGQMKKMVRKYARNYRVSNGHKKLDKKKRGGKRGYVYILKSSSYNNKIKIGQTKERRELKDVKKYLYKRYRTTLGTDLNFVLFETINREEDERNVHEHLYVYRERDTELFIGGEVWEYAVDICKLITGSKPIY